MWKKRLERQIEEFRPGVREAIAVALKAANDAMKREHPGQPLLSLNDFRSAGGDTSGPHATQFFRKLPDRSTLLATVTQSPGMPPQVTIKIEKEKLLCIGDDDKNCFPL